MMMMLVNFTGISKSYVDSLFGHVTWNPRPLDGDADTLSNVSWMADDVVGKFINA